MTAAVPRHPEINMDRRDFSRALAAAAALAAIPACAHSPSTPRTRGAQDPAHDHGGMNGFFQELTGGDPAEMARIMPSTPREVALVVYPGFFPFDILGTKAVFDQLLGTNVHIVSKDLQPVPAGRHVQLLPDKTFETCPENLDVIFVPGGGDGTVAQMRDPAMLAFLQKQARTARYVTSICTGSLVLGAAGLLKGYRATSHWVTHEVLAMLGATPVKARVVEDRNRITGGGVTAGIDFGLTLVARLTSERYAKAVQLNLEYDPAPPFRAGSPNRAGESITGALRTMYRGTVAGAEAAARAAMPG
jgi:cyclohexyl-isocyanide hydratase